MASGSQAQGSNTDVVPKAMLMRLQLKIETLKKNNEEEMSMLRAENVHIKQKLNEETVLNTTFLKIVELMGHIHKSTYNEASFEATQSRGKVKSSMFF